MHRVAGRIGRIHGYERICRVPKPLNARYEYNNLQGEPCVAKNTKRFFKGFGSTKNAEFYVLKVLRYELGEMDATSELRVPKNPTDQKARWIGGATG